MKVFFKIVSIVLMLIGAFGFLSGAFLSGNFFEYEKEIPLGDVQGIAVSSDGRIYLALGFYGKIQAYDSNGNFIKHWNAENSGGAFRIGIHNDIIYVATARGDLLKEYDLNGNIISKEVVNNIYSDYSDTDHFIDRTSTSVYEITKGMFPTVTKTQKGHTETIITIPFLLKIFKGPFPAFLFLMFGVLLQLSLKGFDKLMKKEVNIKY